jgi:hypothetical protein
MTEKELYSYSKDLDTFVRSIRKLMHFNYYLYSRLVDNSPIGDGGFPDGLSCVYARQAKRLGEAQEPELKRALHTLRDHLDTILISLEEEDVRR